MSETNINNKKKKVLLVVTQGELGGAQKYVLDIATGLASRFDITVASGTESRGLLNEVEKHNIDTLPLSSLRRELAGGFLPTWGDFATVRDLVSAMRKNKYDVVHLNSSKIGLLGAVAAKLARVPKVVFTAHGWVFNEPASIRPRRNLWVLASRISALFQGRIICVSRYDYNKAISHNIAPQDKLVTVYNGLDTAKVSYFAPEKAREWIAKKADIKPNSRIIGTIANYYPTKNLPTLIRSFRELPKEYHLVIFGDGNPEQRGKMRSDIHGADLSNRVHLIGSTPNAARYITGLDAYVISSLKEGLPFSALEAMGAGVPIASTSAGGLGEIFFNEEGSHAAILADPNDKVSMARSIKKAVEAPGDIQKNAARRFSEVFTQDQMVQKTSQVWES